MQSSQKPARSPPEARNCWRGCPGHTGPAPGCRQGRSPQGPRSAGEPPAGGRETSCSCRRPGLHVPMRQKEGRVKRGCCEGRDPFNVNMWCQNQSFRRRWGAACRPASPPPHDQRPQHFYSGVTGFPSDVGRVRGCWQHTWVAHAAQGGPPVTVCPPAVSTKVFGILWSSTVSLGTSLGLSDDLTNRPRLLTPSYCLSTSGSH